MIIKYLLVSYELYVRWRCIEILINLNMVRVAVEDFWCSTLLIFLFWLTIFYQDKFRERCT